MRNRNPGSHEHLFEFKNVASKARFPVHSCPHWWGIQEPRQNVIRPKFIIYNIKFYFKIFLLIYTIFLPKTKIPDKIDYVQ
jgi:hypothetical protein